jgi:hypothetical protein
MGHLRLRQVQSRSLYDSLAQRVRFRKQANDFR